MNESIRGQVSSSAADVYEEFFVPALFRPWAAMVADAANIEEGQYVLDVACGTGVLTREIATRVGSGGMVVGLDCNDGMLAVARQLAPSIDWQLGQAEALPCEDEQFDAVVSQFGLMFFEDRGAALREMWRVLRPGGNLAVAVWDSLERTPGYAAMTTLLQRLFGDECASALRAPFVLGEPDELRTIFDAAGIGDAKIVSTADWASFQSIEAWVHTDVKGWTLADLIDDAQYETLLSAARSELLQFVQDDGSVRFRSPAHIVTAGKPG